MKILNNNSRVVSNYSRKLLAQHDVILLSCGAEEESAIKLNNLRYKRKKG